ncbi:hypothetical protein [Amycolatopsis sp. WAC 01376]|nr:hypothetical protein [Amycolatopsis sp. WAC 01376]
MIGSISRQSNGKGSGGSCAGANGSKGRRWASRTATLPPIE